MTAKKRAITPADIISLEDYTKIRKEHRAALVARKRQRRLEVGPIASIHFENYDSMWFQVQEMLYIERGGEAQIEGELAAYNPLIPKGRELVATILFEIEDPERRKRMLAIFGGIENNAFIEVGGERIRGVAEEDQERSTAEGKASSVQFVHFPFTDAQVAAFRRPEAKVAVGFDHPNYGHLSVMPEAVRQALAEDFD